MKEFLSTWLIVSIAGLIVLFFGAALLQFWAVYLLGTALLAGAITAGLSLSERLTAIEKKLDALTAPAEENPVETTEQH